MQSPWQQVALTNAVADLVRWWVRSRALTLIPPFHVTVMIPSIRITNSSILNDDLLPRRPHPPSKTHKVRFLTLLPRRLGFDPVDFLKDFLQPQFERVILGALVEFAEEVSAGDERVEAERQGCIAEVL